MTEWTDGMIVGAVLLSGFILCMLTLLCSQIAKGCLIVVNPNEIERKSERKSERNHIQRRSTPLHSTQHFV